MDVARMRAMEKRTEALEARIAALEELLGTPGGVRAQELLKRYPRGLTKNEAAEEIGVKHYVVEQDSHWNGGPANALRLSAEFLAQYRK